MCLATAIKCILESSTMTWTRRAIPAVLQLSICALTITTTTTGLAQQKAETKGGVAVNVQGDNNRISVNQNDPQVLRILKELQKRADADNSLKDQLRRKDAENDDLKRQLVQAVAAQVQTARSPQATPADKNALAALEDGNTRPTTALLAERELAAAARARRSETEAVQARREAAELARQQGAFAFGQDSRAALAAYQRAAEYEPNDTWTWNFIGDLQMRLGNSREGTNAYRKGLAIAETLAARDPANTEWQRDLSVSHDRIGNVLVAQGDRVAALAAFRKGLAIRETLAARDPANTGWQVDLAVSSAKLGSHEALPANERRQHLQRGLRLLEALAEAERLAPAQDSRPWFREQIGKLAGG